MRGSDAMLAPFVGAGILALVAVFYAFSPVLLVQEYEADVYHLLDLTERLRSGLLPHQETSTPLGFWSYWPIALLVDAGLPAGLAMLWAQMAVALVTLPAFLYVAVTRFRGWTGALYMALGLLLILGLSFGDRSAEVSFSMHYNRWCWAWGLVAVPLAMVPGMGRHGLLEGILIGLAFAAMAMTKVTFFVALLPVVGAALLLRQAWGAAIWAMLTGAMVAGLTTLALGLPFWQAYAADLLSVLRAPFRDSPGNDLASVTILPDYLPGTVLALLGYMALRREDGAGSALSLLLLALGGIYATYQSFGNPPFWYAVAGIVLLAHMSFSARAVGAAFLVLAAPLWVNLAFTVPWHTALARDGGIALIEGQALAIEVDPARQDQFDLSRSYVPGSGLQLNASEVRGLSGTALAACRVTGGLTAWFGGVADAVRASGIEPDSQIFVADTISAHWLAGVGQPPRHSWETATGASAPWYYQGLPGIGAAEVVVTPTCTTDPLRRQAILGALQDSGLSFELLLRHPMAEVHRIIR